jgi:GT2 family glycosyltransferase
VARRNGKTIVGSISVDIMQPEKVAYAGTLWNAWLAKYRSTINTTQCYTEIKSRWEVILSDLLPGRGTLIPVSVFNEIGLFDEVNFPHYAADEDFSARAKKIGYGLVISTAAVVRSHVDQTGLASERMSFKYFIKMFSSIKSAKNLKIRWRWALKHARTPAPVYFLFDFSRLLKSSISK